MKRLKILNFKTEHTQHKSAPISWVFLLSHTPHNTHHNNTHNTYRYRLANQCSRTPHHTHQN